MELESLPPSVRLETIQAILAQELGPLGQLGVTLVLSALAEASVAVVIPCVPRPRGGGGSRRRAHAEGCQPASAQSSPLTAELPIMKQMASAISSVRIRRRSCV